MVEINDPVWKELSSAGNDARTNGFCCLMEGERFFGKCGNSRQKMP